MQSRFYFIFFGSVVLADVKDSSSSFGIRSGCAAEGAKFGMSGTFGESAVDLGKRNKQSSGMRFVLLCFSEIVFLNEKGTSLQGKFCMWVHRSPTKNTWH